jgi:hypothetical protein
LASVNARTDTDFSFSRLLPALPSQQGSHISAPASSTPARSEAAGDNVQAGLPMVAVCHPWCWSSLRRQRRGQVVRPWPGSHRFATGLLLVCSTTVHWVSGQTRHQSWNLAEIPFAVIAINRGTWRKFFNDFSRARACACAQGGAGSGSVPAFGWTR